MNPLGINTLKLVGTRPQVFYNRICRKFRIDRVLNGAQPGNHRRGRQYIELILQGFEITDQPGNKAPAPGIHGVAARIVQVVDKQPEHIFRI
jgi:hypothetical protein